MVGGAALFRDVLRKELLSEFVPSSLDLAGPRFKQMAEFYLPAVLVALLLTAVVVALMHLGSDGLRG